MIPGRFENKYAVPDELGAEVLERARLFLLPDRGIDGTQRVTSLYLETPELTFYKWQNDRRDDRFKLRIRGYGDPPARSVYLEIKRKQGELVRKQRAEVLLHALPSKLHSVAPHDAPALQEFVKTHRDLDAQPRILVSCLRTALRGTNAYGEIAVTFDRNMACQSVSDYDLVGNPNAWRPLPLPEGTTAIVEFKYVQQPPPWMAELMADLAIYRVRFSKFVTAMQQYVGQDQNVLLQTSSK